MRPEIRHGLVQACNQLLHDNVLRLEALLDRGRFRPDGLGVLIRVDGPLVRRGPVFGTTPGQSADTPLWQEVRVTGKNPAAASALGSDTPSNTLATAGKFMRTMTGVVLNGPIIRDTMSDDDPRRALARTHW